MEGKSSPEGMNLMITWDNGEPVGSFPISMKDIGEILSDHFLSLITQHANEEELLYDESLDLSEV